MEFYFDDVWKQRLRQVSVPKIGVEWIKVMGGPTPIIAHWGPKISFLTNSELGIN
jgi:hypothetical protein